MKRTRVLIIDTNADALIRIYIRIYATRKIMRQDDDACAIKTYMLQFISTF